MGAPDAMSAPATREFSLSISRALGTVVVTTHGLLDANSAVVLGCALLDLIDDQGNLTVVVDLADLQVSDPMCLSALAPAASAAARHGGRLTFADPSEAVEWGLLLTDLTGTVVVTSARRAAMAQHPAGRCTTPIVININTQGATQ